MPLWSDSLFLNYLCIKRKSTNLYLLSKVCLCKYQKQMHQNVKMPIQCVFIVVHVLMSLLVHIFIWVGIKDEKTRIFVNCPEHCQIYCYPNHNKVFPLGFHFYDLTSPWILNTSRQRSGWEKDGGRKKRKRSEVRGRCSCSHRITKALVMTQILLVAQSLRSCWDFCFKGPYLWQLPSAGERFIEAALPKMMKMMMVLITHRCFTQHESTLVCKYCMSSCWHKEIISSRCSSRSIIT